MPYKDPEVGKCKKQEWYQRNRKEILDRHKEMYWQDPEAARKKRKEQRDRDPERKKKRREYHARNREHVNEVARTWRARNPERCRQYHRRDKERHPERVRATNNAWKRRRRRERYEETRAKERRYEESARLRKYGITPEEFSDLRALGCGICGREISGKNCHFDHCHETGIFRGLLCSCCNVGIGMFRESPDLMRAAISWVERVASWPRRPPSTAP